MSEERKENIQTGNPLGEASVASLMVKFAVPSIIAMLVSALYNIVDQLFIGQAVGTLGNAATNVAFPLTTSCIALALMFGIGGASCFNLNMGGGHKDRAVYFVGNAIICLIGSGVILFLIAELFNGIWCSGKCPSLRTDLCADYSDRFPIFDFDNGRMSSDSCRR